MQHSRCPKSRVCKDKKKSVHYSVLKSCYVQVKSIMQVAQG